MLMLYMIGYGNLKIQNKLHYMSRERDKRRVRVNKEMQKRIRGIISQMNNPRNDGFVAFGAKQELWEIKWMVDEALSDTPEFSTEQEWLDSRINAMTLL